jgi:PhnB protein
MIEESNVSIKSISPYIFLNGNAAEAIEFYVGALGASVSGIMRWKDMPPEFGGCTAEDAERIMHAELVLGPVSFMVADRPSSRVGSLVGNIDINLGFTDAAAIEDAFAKLAVGGQVNMPLHDAFWGDRFGALIDRFGVNWMLTGPRA